MTHRYLVQDSLTGDEIVFESKYADNQARTAFIMMITEVLPDFILRSFVYETEGHEVRCSLCNNSEPYDTMTFEDLNNVDNQCFKLITKEVSCSKIREHLKIHPQESITQCIESRIKCTRLKKNEQRKMKR